MMTLKWDGGDDDDKVGGGGGWGEGAKEGDTLGQVAVGVFLAIHSL